METYFVKSRDSVLRTSSLACKTVEKSGSIELQALGSTCVTTALKSATRASGKLMSKGTPATISVSYGSTECDGKQLPTVRLTLKSV